jgi:hypothetical protein
MTARWRRRGNQLEELTHLADQGVSTLEDLLTEAQAVRAEITKVCTELREAAGGLRTAAAELRAMAGEIRQHNEQGGDDR